MIFERDSTENEIGFEFNFKLSPNFRKPNEVPIRIAYFDFEPSEEPPKDHTHNLSNKFEKLNFLNFKK